MGILNIKIADKTIKVNKGIQGKLAEREEQVAKCKHLSTVYFLQLLVHKAHGRDSSLEGLQLSFRISSCSRVSYTSDNSVLHRCSAYLECFVIHISHLETHQFTNSIIQNFVLESLLSVWDSRLNFPDLHPDSM